MFLLFSIFLLTEKVPLSILTGSLFYNQIPKRRERIGTFLHPETATFKFMFPAGG